MSPADGAPRFGRGALVGFPGVPIWIAVGAVGATMWLIMSATRDETVNWETAAVGWTAVLYAAALGMTFGRLLPRVTARRACAPRGVPFSPWLGAYSWPVGIVVLIALVTRIHGEPRGLVLWAAAATLYCLAIDLADYRTMSRLARGPRTPRGA